MKITAAIVVICALFFSTRALAEMSSGELLQRYSNSNAETQKFYEAIVGATENGISWANSHEKNMENGKMIYCPPDKIALTGPQIIDILQRETTEKPFTATEPYGLAIMTSLIDAFPCR